VPPNRALFENTFSTIILAAGKGTRMYSKTPKVLHTILGKPIISFAVQLARTIKTKEIIVVIGKHAHTLRKTIGTGVKYAVQARPLGSGDAAKNGIAVATGTHVLIVNGDVPLLSETTVFKLLAYHEKQNAVLTILTCTMKNPFGYGRIIRNKNNSVSGIIEQTDATAQQQKIKEINVGVYYGKRDLLSYALDKITSVNRQGEYYLTDIVHEVIREKKKVAGLKINNEEEILGINSKYELARAREIAKARWFEQLMLGGVDIEDPLTTIIDLSVRFGKNVRIRPHTIIEGNTTIKSGTTVGPFVWIRNGKKMGIGVHVKT
jgi:bifunctional UDP-N-acetylglucosamine pyrophosphorylase/glucosamine-1-phosphate N-acetyltransferase